jgi:hypothetical protein
LKTRSSAFNVAWGNRRVRKAVFQITYKRRYWNGSAYVLESSSHTIPANQISRVSGLSTKYDVPLQNRILSGNVTIVLKDKAYKWLPTNTANGVWRRDSTATSGYEPVRSEFTIYYGYILADGTTELLPIFTGLIIEDPKFDSTSGLVTIPLIAKSEAKLDAADAQKVGTALTGQATSPATGDGSNLSFSTLTKSLWNVSAVTVDGVAKTQGTQYTLGNLNDAEVEATIDFVSGSAPASGKTVLWNGNQWYRDKSISALVGYLCDQAGIGSADRTIEEPTFAGVDQSHTWKEQVDWLLFALTNASANVKPGWITFGEELLGRDLQTADDLTHWAEGGSGTRAVQSSGGWDGGAYTRFYSSGIRSGNLRVKLVPTGAGTTITTDLALSGAWTLASITAGADGPYNLTFAIVSGGVEYYTQTADRTISGNGTKVSFYYLAYQPIGIPESPPPLTIGLSRVRAVTASGSIVSPEIDLLAAPTSWLPFEYTITLNGGTITIKTNVASSSGGTYDGEIALDGADTPQSSLKRYAKVSIYATPNSDSSDMPEIDLARLNWRGSSLFIKSADFTGQTCLEAIQELAALSGMEFGSNGDGTFYFRNRAVSGEADIAISQKDAIVAVTDWSAGYKEVLNVIQVTYGTSGQDGYYFAEYGATQAGEASPTTAERFGQIVYQLDLQRFIFSNDAQVAQAIARKLYELNYRPKRKLRIRTRIIPQLDLADKMSLSFHDSPLIEKAIFGDPLQRYPVTGANSKTLARDILMKVVGHAPDLVKSESVIDLEEVLS